MHVNVILIFDLDIMQTKQQTGIKRRVNGCVIFHRPVL